MFNLNHRIPNKFLAVFATPAFIEMNQVSTLLMRQFEGKGESQRIVVMPHKVYLPSVMLATSLPVLGPLLLPIWG